jgi:inhibitor of apoptosis domain-containing protein
VRDLTDGVCVQLVEGGWYFSPNDESDDMATCAYCQLKLDGWEAGDKPM